MTQHPDLNPYVAPTAVLATPYDAIVDLPRLHSPHQVMGASWLGTPIAGCWLLAANYRALHQPQTAQTTLLVGALVTSALLGLAFVLPDWFPNSVLPIAYSVAMLRVAKRLQGETFDHHLASGGPKHSAWRAFLVGVTSLLALVTLVSISIFAWIVLFD
jgi:hypothetical protein